MNLTKLIAFFVAVFCIIAQVAANPLPGKKWYKKVKISKHDIQRLAQKVDREAGRIQGQLKKVREISGAVGVIASMG